MFNSDQPIKTQKEDLLGRSSFAKSIGDAILSYDSTDSLSIGLFGEWGSGKTSIINMIIEEMENQSQDSMPIIVKFNPWNFSDQNQLITQFFSQIILEFNNYENEKSKKLRKKLVKALEKYSQHFDKISDLKGIPIIGWFISVLGVVSGFFIQEKNVNEIKNKINIIIEGLKTKIIIVIDDIDRLNNTEIRQIFQLVKSLGDFPNTIYLLSFDKSVVIKALANEREGYGSDYLEKVIQVPFEIPRSTEEVTHTLLINQLNDLTTNTPEDKIDSAYWGNVFQSGMKYFFRNVRDVTRYMNTLKFNYDLLKDDVNIIDLFAITAIQVFMPILFYDIRDNKNLFCGDDNYGLGNKDKQLEKEKKLLDSIFRNVEFPRYDIFKKFMQTLFPHLDSIYGSTHFSNDFHSSWRREGRICHSDNFDLYFTFTIPKEEISIHEIERVLSKGNDQVAFSEELLKLNDEGKIIRFLHRFQDYTRDQIPEDHIRPIVSSLMDIGDLFPENKSGFWDSSTSLILLRIFYQLSHCLKTHNERYSLFRFAIETANRSLYTIVHEVGVQMQQHGENGETNPKPMEERTVNSDQLSDLKSYMRDKIQLWANDGRLMDHKELVPILYQWKQLTKESIVKDFINKMISTDMGLINFVAGFMMATHSISVDSGSQSKWSINLESVKEFIELEKVEPRIREFPNLDIFRELDEKEQDAVKLFIDTFDGKIVDRF